MIPYKPRELHNHACYLYEGKGWHVANLFNYCNDPENADMFELDTHSLALHQTIWGELSMFELINHYRQAMDTDLTHPVIVSAEGWVLDGWHRIVKAILTDVRYLPAVRMKVNPPYDFEDGKII